MECPWNKFCEKNKQYAPLVLRIVVGVSFAAHGWMKLQNVAGTAGFFGNIGIPLPLVMAWFVTLAEFLGGIALVLGLGVRYIGATLAIIMSVAVLKVHLKNGLLGQGGYELALLLMAASLSLALSGAGPISLDWLLCGKKKSEMKTESVSEETEGPKAKPKKSKR